MTLQSDVVPWPLEVFVSSRHGLFVLRFQKPSRKPFAFENIGCLPSDLVCRPRLAAVTQYKPNQALKVEFSTLSSWKVYGAVRGRYLPFEPSKCYIFCYYHHKIWTFNFTQWGRRVARICGEKRKFPSVILLKLSWCVKVRLLSCQNDGI